MAVYYNALYDNPVLRLTDILPLVKYCMANQRAVELKDALILDGIPHSVAFNPITMAVTLRWCNEEGKQSALIYLVSHPSNLLPNAVVYYFRCPLSGRKARILYKTIDDKFACKQVLRNAYYPMQQVGRHLRFTKVLYKQEPYKRNGKRWYGGKLTPYGKKCEQWEQENEKYEQALIDILSV